MIQCGYGQYHVRLGRIERKGGNGSYLYAQVKDCLRKLFYRSMILDFGMSNEIRSAFLKRYSDSFKNHPIWSNYVVAQYWEAGLSFWSRLPFSYHIITA